MANERYHDTPTPPADMDIEDPPRDSGRPGESARLSEQRPEATAEPRDAGFEDPPRESDLPSALPAPPSESAGLGAPRPEATAETSATDIEDPPRESEVAGAPPAAYRSALPREEDDPVLQQRLSGLTGPSETKPKYER